MLWNRALIDYVDPLAHVQIFMLIQFYVESFVFSFQLSNYSLHVNILTEQHNATTNFLHY